LDAGGHPSISLGAGAEIGGHRGKAEKKKRKLKFSVFSSLCSSFSSVLSVVLPFMKSYWKRLPNLDIGFTFMIFLIFTKFEITIFIVTDGCDVV
jgi:membrane protein CcdC involved in cytochrome C biogenesis